jgi:murein DD-endopeptidase MepM/ murein hydrolase activator NlpD
MESRWMLVVLLVMLAGCASGGDGVAVRSTTEATVAEPTVAPPTPTVEATPTTEPTATPTVVPQTPTEPPSPTVAPTTTSTAMPTEPPALVAPQWSYPIGVSGGVAGDGFWMRHGYATENTWFNPGYWHTGEDWYALEGDTAGAEVRAVAPGEVVYAGSNYPGRVVIVRHDDELVSMYGHLDPALRVAEGQRVGQGEVLGTVLRREDDVPNHLHFEIRTWVFADAVNGDAPRYPFRCGVGCAPGPGYWPIAAPDLPDALGWRNPVHVIAQRSGWTNTGVSDPVGEVVAATSAPSPTLTLWQSLDANGVATGALGEVATSAGERFAVLDVWSGPEAPGQTGATSYQLWYRVRLADGREGWAAALVADTNDTGSDGRASSVRFNLLPVVQ